MDGFKLSYSALICFLNNQIQFKKRYIAKVYDDQLSPSYVVGSAIHRMIEQKLRGESPEDAIAAGLEAIENAADYEIDYGKTGSREKILAAYQSLTDSVLKELPDYQNIIDIEAKLDAEVSISGKKVPMTGRVDLVRDLGDGTIEILDWKSVAAYSAEDEENYKYVMQAWFYVLLSELKYGKPVARVVFQEIKKTKNKDSSPQVRSYILARNQIQEANDTIGRIVKDAYEYISNPDAKYFPNPSDMMNGRQSVEIYAQLKGTTIRTVHATESKPKFSAVNTVVAEDVVKSDGSESERIMAKLAEFGIGGKIENVVSSHSVETYMLRPNRGVKMSKIATMGDDLSLALSSEAVRIIAPIYGTQTVGIEVPKEQTFPTCENIPAGTVIPIGVDTMNNIVYDDIAKMPHMLIGGQTGSGKSVFIKNIIASLKGCDVTVVDCKMIDFIDLDGKYCDVITERDEAIRHVAHLVDLMDRRYRNRVKNGKRKVLVIDEYADLVMGLGKEKIPTMGPTGKMTYETIDRKAEFEQNLCRLLQKARAANINVIIATQRPSADIVSPIIKANCPVKACLRVATAKNSEIVLDEAGGEKLLGKGDMLYLGSGKVNPVRLQCFAPIGEGL